MTEQEIQKHREANRKWKKGWLQRKKQEKLAQQRKCPYCEFFLEGWHELHPCNSFLLATATVAVIHQKVDVFIAYWDN